MCMQDEKVMEYANLEFRLIIPFEIKITQQDVSVHDGAN